MRVLGKVLFAAVLVSLIVVTGCKETYNMTFTNTSTSPKELDLRDTDGFHQFGPLDVNQRIHYTLKVDKDELPASCELKSGSLVKPFTLDKNGAKDLNFYIEDGQIVGPLTKHMEVKHSTKSETTSTDQHEIVTPDTPTTPKQPGEKIIDQHEVVE